MSRKALSAPEWIPFLLPLASEAGSLIMTYYKDDHIVIRKKDASPVTEADRAADRLIVAALRTRDATIPIVSEEGEKPDVSDAEYFWLVDPLDGTRSFIRGHGYFTVNIALIHSPSLSSPSLTLPLQGGNQARGVPILGIIYDPVNEIMYWGSTNGAFSQAKGGAPTPIHCREIPLGGAHALISHNHLNEATESYLRERHIEQRIPCASSIKFCFLAEGKADIYPRFGPTSEWDTAAGHAILNAAGGRMTTPEGTPFLYGKSGFRNGNFIASGK